jgi:hypothetical protein
MKKNEVPQVTTNRIQYMYVKNNVIPYNLISENKV